jgi:WD40 repeat protein
MQTAAGLAAAHAQGLIHRDIKPANILLENGVERVRITDFGLARAVADASLTQSGVVAGTPQYMSPEQARGEAVDQRTDLFSLGSVLYAMCAGRPPFRATTGIAVLKRVCEDTPSPLKEINAEIPAWLAEIVTKLHAKDPAGRFQSAAEVAELLNRHLAHLQHPSVVGQVSNLPVDPRAGCQPSPRRRRWAMAAAVLLLCVIVGLGFSEATGVTSLRATVIRIFTPDGTLVVEVDDPAVKVTIEGDGGIVITGAGLQEVRLKPGSYKVHAAKDGKPVRLDQELVTITRGDKQVVKVSLEAIGLAKATPPLVPRAILKGHGSWVHSLAFSPDGKTLATGSNDQHVRLWYTATGNLTGQFHADDGLITSLAYSPDGTVLVTASNEHKVRVWDAATFKLLAEAKQSLVRTVAFRRGDSMLATASDDKTVKLWKWDGAVLVPVRTLGEHSSAVSAMSFNPQGTVIAAATGDGMLYLWDVESGKPLKSVRLGLHWLTCLAFSPDGMTIAVGGYDKRVELRKADTLESVGTLRGHKESVYSLVFLPDGKTLVSAGAHFDMETRNSERPGELKLWDTARLKERLSVDGYESGILCVAISPDGKTLATGDHSNLGRLWDVDALLAAARAGQTADAGAANVLKGAVLHMTFEKDTFYEKEGKTYVRNLSGNGHDGLCEGVAFTPEGKGGGGLKCDGKGVLRIPHSWFNHKANYTVTAWVRLQKNAPDGELFREFTSQKDESIYVASLVPGGVFFCAAYNRNATGNWNNCDKAGVFPYEKWVFLTIALENGGAKTGSLRVTIDDKEYHLPSQMVDSPTKDTSVTLGKHLEGKLGEVAVFHRFLSAQEIEAIRRRGKQEDTKQVTKAEAAKPVLLMHFDKADFYEKDGKTYVRDRSGNGNDGLCEQVQFTPQGNFGGGLANAGKGFLRLKSSLITGKSNFTIAGWVKLANLNKSWNLYSVINADYPTTTLQARFTLVRQPESYLFAAVWNDVLAKPWMATTSGEHKVLPEEWLFVAAALEEGGPGKGHLRLVLNDRIWEKPFQQIGGSLDGIQDFAALNLDGVLDELAVWDRALTEQELRELFAVGQPNPKK